MNAVAGQFEIVVRLRCCNLPGARFEERTRLRLGIQKGAEVVDDVPADVEEVTFTVPMRVGVNANTGRPNFLGAFAHGTPDERFLYLCWVERNGPSWDLVRRAKVPLKQWDWERLEQSRAAGEPLEITLDMTDKHGGPICGSVRV